MAGPRAARVLRPRVGGAFGASRAPRNVDTLPAGRPCLEPVAFGAC